MSGGGDGGDGGVGNCCDNPPWLGEWGFKWIGIYNAVYSEIAPQLPLPFLPPFCGAVDHELHCLFDDQPQNSLNNRNDLLAQARRISELLRDTDVSYLDLKSDAKACNHGMVEDLDLCREVLECNPNAFECNLGGMKLNLDGMTSAVQDDSTPKDGRLESKRKLAFNVPIPRKRRTKTNRRGPRQQPLPVKLAQSLPEGSSPNSTPVSIYAEKPSEWLLMLSYKILTGNDPHLAMVLTEVASSMDDSKWDVIRTRLELVKLQTELKEAKSEASKAKEEARIMGEEVKAVKSDMEEQVKVGLEITRRSNPNILLVDRVKRVMIHPSHYLFVRFIWSIFIVCCMVDSFLLVVEHFSNFSFQNVQICFHQSTIQME